MKDNKQIKENMYVCPVCGKTYEKRKSDSMGCLVKHATGDCCHFNEKEIIKKILSRNKKQ